MTSKTEQGKLLELWDLENWRIEKGYSIRRLAREAGISAAYISDIEHDHRSGSDEVYKKLAKVLGVHPSNLRRKWPNHAMMCANCGKDEGEHHRGWCFSRPTEEVLKAIRKRRRER